MTTVEQDIDSIRSRLVEAESERHGWGMTKLQDKYLEACSKVDALTLQLEQACRRGPSSAPASAE